MNILDSKSKIDAKTCIKMSTKERLLLVLK
jgi:hypothetical protein